MPTALNFTTLQEQLRRYLERGWTAASDPEVYTQLPEIINDAERRCARELKISGFQNVTTAGFTASVAVYEKPDRWKETISMNYGTGTGNNTRNPIFPRSYEFLRNYWPDDTSTSTPEIYADYDYQHFIVAPTPAAAYPFELIYWQLLPLLDSVNTTNWLTEFAPDLLKPACLLEAAPFLKSAEAEAHWQGWYDRAASAYNGEDIQKILDRAVGTRAKA